MLREKMDSYKIIKTTKGRKEGKAKIGTKNKGYLQKPVINTVDINETQQNNFTIQQRGERSEHPLSSIETDSQMSVVPRGGRTLLECLSFLFICAAYFPSSSQVSLQGHLFVATLSETKAGIEVAPWPESYFLLTSRNTG